MSHSKRARGDLYAEIDQDSNEMVPQKAHDFQRHLRVALQGRPRVSSATKVNEEELFAGVITSRLQEEKGVFVAENFTQLVNAKIAEPPRPNGRVPSYERVAKSTLLSMAKAGFITEEERTSIQHQAFVAAQLDRNRARLYDSVGDTRADEQTLKAIKLATRSLIRNGYL